jgi:excisionase family DNA binding protein
MADSKNEGPSRTGEQSQGEDLSTPEMTFAAPLRLLTKDELAAALRVSPRTIQEMVSAEEIPVVRIRGAVRFYLPDVVRSLTASAVTSKRGCSRKLQAEVDHGIRGIRGIGFPSPPQDGCPNQLNRAAERGHGTK